MRICTAGNREYLSPRTGVCAATRGEMKKLWLRSKTSFLLKRWMRQVDQILAMMVRSLATNHVGLVQQAIENIL
jgi:hypothetical protein